MEFTLTVSGVLWALAIFLIRVLSITMDTLRFMLTMRGNKTISWFLGFIESVLFVVVMGAVLDDLNNVLNIVGYAAGFATGNVVGMEIEKRLAIGFSHIKIVSKQRGLAVAEALRAMDYAVTEIPARGNVRELRLPFQDYRRGFLVPEELPSFREPGFIVYQAIVRKVVNEGGVPSFCHGSLREIPLSFDHLRKGRSFRRFACDRGDGQQYGYNREENLRDLSRHFLSSAIKCPTVMEIPSSKE